MSGFVLYEQRTLRPCLKQLLRLYLLLHLRVLLDLQSSPTVLPLSLSHHVETRSGPLKRTTALESFSEGLWDTSPNRFTDSNTLRWTWWESNPRPQCLRYEGITTILYLLEPYTSTTTLRFSLRPCAVLFDATGWLSPLLSEYTRAESTPWLAKYRLTASARR